MTRPGPRTALGADVPLRTDPYPMTRTSSDIPNTPSQIRNGTTGTDEGAP